jgi:bifunctional dihydroflavonol 4-reductase/flavanone 4-reductase
LQLTRHFFLSKIIGNCLKIQNEVIKPTINGLIDILKACEKAKTVRKLVFTSSAGTVDVTEHPKSIIDETCWSDVDFCRRVKMTGWVSN